MQRQPGDLHVSVAAGHGLEPVVAHGPELLGVRAPAGNEPSQCRHVGGAEVHGPVLARRGDDRRIGDSAVDQPYP